MQIKYAHPIFRQGGCFCRHFFFDRQDMPKSSYCYDKDVQGLSNFVVMSDDLLYDYSKILEYNDLSCYKDKTKLSSLIDGIVSTHRVSELTESDFNKIVMNNIAVASHVKNLIEQYKFISLIEQL